MKQIRLHNISDNYFHEAWELYEDAFPLEERRLMGAQARVLKKSKYHFDVIVEKEQLIGFLLWWDFEPYRYIDHFATATLQRNKGFGKSILKKFIANNDKPILLEAELPNSEINLRRIKFYERIGLKLNQHYYEIPPFKEGQRPLQLLLMSYTGSMTVRDVEQFVKICHPIAFED